MRDVKRIDADKCCGVIVDLQKFFLAQVDARRRARIASGTSHFVRLLDYFQIPVMATLERPVARKGELPADVAGHVRNDVVFEKDFFDLTKEKAIADHLAGLKRKQVLVAGCETDVCVMQSCLGLLALDYDVYIVEELIFSSARNVTAAIERMKTAGATFVTYKMLFYELIEAVDGNPHAETMIETFGEFPDDLPDTL